MARHLRLAAVGVRPPSQESRILERGSMLDLVIHHIRREVEPALAWRPELILLPECCDRPLDLPPSERKRWDAESAPKVLDMLSRLAREHSVMVAYGAGPKALVVLERDGSVCGTRGVGGSRRGSPEQPGRPRCPGSGACLLQRGDAGLRFDG